MTAVVLETDVRFSRSLLWEAQRRYYDAKGVAAWRTNAVPHYVTNTPALAQAYAEVVLGLLRDLDAGAWGSLDARQPLYVVELGAGTGRFGFLFLTALEKLRRQTPGSLRAVKYVLTDVAPANLKFMTTRRVLAPFFAQGLLDVARFDAEKDTDLFLELARRRLAPGTLANPLVVIANYVFDGLSQDVFHVERGELRESLVTTLSPTGPIDVAAPEPFAALDLRFALRPIEGAFYEEPELERTLRRQARETDGTFLFPCTVLRAIRRLAALAGGRLCLVAADWNDHVEKPERPPGDPRVSRHGSFSLAVNFQALADHVEEAGGLTLKMRHQHRQLEQAAFVLGPPPGGLPELSAAFALRIAESGPDDLSTLRRTISLEGMDVGQLLALVRVWHHDPGVLGDVLPLVAKNLATTTPVGRREIVRTVERVLENYYPIGELPDLALESAGLLYRMGEHAKALALLETSLGDWQETALVRFNMGLCCLGLRNTAQAKEHFDRAFALEPGFQAASAFQGRGAR